MTRKPGPESKIASVAVKTAETLRQALGDLDPAAFAKDTKDQRITIRMCGKDRESMERIAEALGLTVADYLVQLHRIAVERLDGPQD